MYRCLVFFALALVFGGCSSPPQLPSESRVSISEVVDRVQCELAEAVKPYLKSKEHSWIKNWAAGYALTLKVEDEGSIVASSDFIRNLTPGILTFSVNAGLAGSATRTATLEFNLYVDELATYECLPASELKGKYFSQTTGMAEWLNRVMGSMDARDTVNVPSKFGHILDFTIKISGGAGPSWVFEWYKPKGAASGSRKDTHNLAITFTQRPKPSDICGDKVQVTNFPDWMYDQAPDPKTATDTSRKLILAEKKRAARNTSLEECRARYQRDVQATAKEKGRRRFTPVDYLTQQILSRDLQSLQILQRPTLPFP